jgi:hypothetical protein
MLHFTQRIKAGGTFYSFYFNSPDKGLGYQISVIDKNRKSHLFTMEAKEGKWIVVNPEGCPYWIVQLEGQFSDAILANYQGED